MGSLKCSMCKAWEAVRGAAGGGRFSSELLIELSRGEIWSLQSLGLNPELGLGCNEPLGCNASALQAGGWPGWGSSQDPWDRGVNRVHMVAFPCRYLGAVGVGVSLAAPPCSAKAADLPFW